MCEGAVGVRVPCVCEGAVGVRVPCVCEGAVGVRVPCVCEGAMGVSFNIHSNEDLGRNSADTNKNHNTGSTF